jgi:Mg-chelatase subunit ChlD
MSSGRRPLVIAAVVVLVTAVLAGALWSLHGLAPGLTAAPPMQRAVKNPCTTSITKTIQPDTIRLCEQSEVTVAMRPTCPGIPINIVIIIDEVYKIGYSNPNDRATAIRNAIQRLAYDKQGNINVGLVWMQDGRASQRVELTTDVEDVIAQLNIPMISRFDAQPQCFECGFREAARMLDKFAKAHAGEDIKEFTILAPLGVYTDPVRPGIIRGANLVKARGVTSITTCFAWTHCAQELQEAATAPYLYLGYGEGTRLAALLYTVVRQSIATFLREVTLTDLFPDAVEVITDSVAPAAVLDPQARSLGWTFKAPILDAYTLTYRVKPLALGTWRLGDGSSVLLTDSHFREATVAVPVPELKVPVICEVTPTPTLTPTPAPTDTPTPTPTNTPTRTPTPTPVPPTPTPRPQPIYLPILIREQCIPSRTYTDVALVLDLSTTMREPSADGRRKIDVVQAAAQLFLDRMTLAGDERQGSDQVAIVAFNRTAWIQQPLTRDRSALRTAIERLPLRMEEYTRLDLAFERGAEALRDERHTINSPVLIVLTDGLPNQVPYAEDGTVETTVLRAAAAAKAAGITVYTIGVGRPGGAHREINPDLLRAAASRPNMYFGALDAGQVAGIYGELTRVIPCGGARYWPGR